MLRRSLAPTLALALAVGLFGSIPAYAAPSSPASVDSAAVALTPASEDLELPGESVDAEDPAVAEDGSEVGFARQEITDPVAIAAVTVPAGADPGQVFVRTVSGGTPTEWEAVPAEDEAPASGDKTSSTVPVVVSGADAVEVAAVAATEPATLEVYSSTVTKADTAASDLAWASPQIMSRKAWQADESLVREAYTVGVVTGAMIHHTAGTNDYTANEVPALLRAIQRYHVEGRGWNDLAYNVLVDKYGRAWEGRGGGLTKAIAGGHAWGETNKRVFGISLMGNYEEVQPPAVMIETMNQVIAWKLALHGVNPHGSTWGSGGQDGGSTSPPAISGHRDENATLCPGKYVYAKFPEIRARVTQIMKEASQRFTDVPAGTPHEEHINWLADKKISTGYADGTFRPTQPVNRDAMAAFMYRLAGSPTFDPAGRQSFVDVTPTTAFYKEIEWLAATGISTGWDGASGREFRPGEPVKRDAMAAFLYRLYGSRTHAAPAKAPFLDVPVGTQFDKEIDWLATSGISTGWVVTGGSEFRPAESVNRDAMAAFMHRAHTTFGTPKPASTV